MDIIVLYIHRNLSVFMVTFDFMKHVCVYIYSKNTKTTHKNWTFFSIATLVYVKPNCSQNFLLCSMHHFISIRINTDLEPTILVLRQASFSSISYNFLA